DLAAIASSTKVKVALFEGLERDDLSKWPSSIFRRSFVRAYASAIGLDPEAVLREFLERFPDPAESIPAAASTAEQTASTPPAPDAAPRADTVLRLTLAETGIPFSGGRLLAQTRRRWAAVAWDTGVVFAIAVMLFGVVGEFWSSLGISMLCYYTGGILILGNTPGVCLFAPRPGDDRDATPPASVPGAVDAGEPTVQKSSTVYPFKSARR